MLSRHTGRRLIYGLAALLLTIACGRPPSLADSTPFAITSIAEVGSGTDGRRHFELRGTFDSATDARAEVICNGDPASAAIGHAERTRIDVSIPEPPGRTRCTFTLARMTDGARTTLSAASTVQVKDPPNEIAGSRDLGVAGGRHVVELYGAFASPASLDARSGVTCNALSGSNVQQQFLGNHFNIAFDDVGEQRCSFVFRYGDGRRTNLWGPLNLRPHPPLTGWGTYLWTTETRPRRGEDNALESSALPLFRAGFDVIRVHMSPIWREAGVFKNHYKFNVDMFNGECPPEVPFLPCAARTNAFQRLASSPSARVVMMTVGDSTPPDLVFNADTWTSGSAVRAGVVREYRDLALALYETQANTGKTFIVSSYESDNDLFCGCGVIGFVKDTNDCRTKCEDGKTPHWKAMEGLRGWFQARHDGIQIATTIAATRGIKNVVVADALETSSVRWLHNMTSCRKVIQGRATELLPHCPNILDDVVPIVQPAYVSWSAWEGIRDDLPNRAPFPFAGDSVSSMPGRTPRLDADLADLKVRLAAMPGSPQLIVGEFGVESFPNLALASHCWAYGEIAKSVQRARLPVNVAWAAYDSNEDGNLRLYGLFNTDGADKCGMTTLRLALNEGAAEMASLPNPPGRIAGVIASVARAGGSEFDLFEVFGTFPAPPQQSADIVLICNGSRVLPADLTLLGANANQVNFRIERNPADHPASEPDDVTRVRYCSVKFPGTWTHGPKKLWPGPCPRAVCR